jgi:acyl-CoA dehydrogenase
MLQERNIPLYQPQNYYKEDPFFRKIIQHYLPPEEFKWAEDYLNKMGELSAKEITPLTLISDQRRPVHIPYDAAGNRVDEIKYDASYLQSAKHVYEFGIIGLGESSKFRTEKKFYGPLLKFGIGYLFSQSGSVLYCPICMTDGTVQVLKRHGSSEMKAKWIPRLTDMKIETMYDGAMYLTEVQGGSDVGSNTCKAIQKNGQWFLEGEKWFCSSIGSKTALVLARPEGAPEGTRGLGLFLVPRDLESGERNKILVRKIKNKLGTCEMATGEVEFHGAFAYPVGEIDQGFSYMTDMLNLSRAYNAIWSIGLMRRAFLEAKVYAEGRKAFGKPIIQYPLVAHTLRQMEEDTEKALCLVMQAISHMDRIERGSGKLEDEILLRLYTPVIKLFTAEKAIEAAHRAIEILGGNGCIEDFPVAKMLRDTQILAIWEGTANILSLDLLRVLKKTEAKNIFLEQTQKEISSLKDPRRKDSLQNHWQKLKTQISDVLEGKDGFGGELACRDLAVQFALFSQELTRVTVEVKS